MTETQETRMPTDMERVLSKSLAAERSKCKSLMDENFQLTCQIKDINKELETWRQRPEGGGMTGLPHYLYPDEEPIYCDCCGISSEKCEITYAGNNEYLCHECYEEKLNQEETEAADEAAERGE